MLGFKSSQPLRWAKILFHAHHTVSFGPLVRQVPADGYMVLRAMLLGEYVEQTVCNSIYCKKRKVDTKSHKTLDMELLILPLFWLDYSSCITPYPSLFVQSIQHRRGATFFRVSFLASQFIVCCSKQEMGCESCDVRLWSLDSTIQFRSPKKDQNNIV